MTAPGWYPDPQGGPGRRYWDGTRWTEHTDQQPQQPQGYGQAQQGYGQQQQGYGQQQPGYGQQQGFAPQQPYTPQEIPGQKRRSNTPLWIALGVSVALILGIGTWLLFLRPASDVAVPPVTTTTSAPAEETTTPAETTPAETTPPVTPTNDASFPPIDIPAAGDALQPLADCPGTAEFGIGELDAEGRLTAREGLSMPAVTGFTPTPMQFPWVHGSNSQYKEYPDTDWAAALQVGNLEAAEGFTDHATAGVRLAQCFLGTPEFGYASATVVAYDSNPADKVTFLDVDFGVPGGGPISTDRTTFGTFEHEGILHVIVTIVPDNDPDGYAAIQKALNDLSVK